MSVAEFQRLKKQHTELSNDIIRAEGARDQLLAQLQTDFGCKSLKEAKKLLSSKKADEEKVRKVFDKKLEEFKLKWKDVI